VTNPSPEPGLFDAEPYLVEPDQAEPLSADRRRTQRQAADITQGRHPLAGAPIHQLAPTDAARGDRMRPFTCGTCAHRTSRRGYSKCDLAPDTRGAGTDLRLWWPACTNYDDTPRGDA
jgi:hypothetical protein